MVYNEKRGLGHMHDHDFDYERIAELRNRYVPDEAVLSSVNPSKNDVIVDIGSGEGHYSELFAKNANQVFSVDHSKKAIDLVKNKIVKKSISNLTACMENVCSEFSPKGFNKVFFGTSFHDIPCRDNLIKTLISRSSGKLRITFLEFKKADTVGPPVEIRISEEELEEYMKKMGFTKENSKDLEIHYIHSYSKS